LCVRACVRVRPKAVSQRRPVGEQIGEPVGDFAPGWDKAKGRPVCVCTIEKKKSANK